MSMNETDEPFGYVSPLVPKHSLVGDEHKSDKYIFLTMKGVGYETDYSG